MPYEIRWFYKHNFDEIKEWWELQNFPYNDEGQRTDYYFLIPTVDNLSIKIRENKLEVKWRIPNSQKRFETERLEGFIEEWIKWGWSDSKPQINDPVFNFLSESPKGPIIKIIKRRLSRKFELSSDNKCKYVKWIDFSESGFSIELTEIKLGQEQWWSIGFETLGNKPTLESFQTKVRELTNTIPLKLQLENSFGYPKWILTSTIE